MDAFPTFIKVKDKTVLVIGGTEDALHKVRLLRKSEAKSSFLARLWIKRSKMDR